MRYDELAFFNSQLAKMLDGGIPLEGALARLSKDMRKGRLRKEVELLRSSLESGTPIAEALEARDLPELYKRMVKIGAESNDLPGILQMLSDHYRRTGLAWTRLKGLMVYPAMVLLTALAFSLFFAFFLGPALSDGMGEWGMNTGRLTVVQAIRIKVLVPPFILLSAVAVGVVAVSFRSLRNRLRWRLPAFKDASVAQAASTMAMMLRGGSNLADCTQLLAEVESGCPAGHEIARWQARLAEGKTAFADIAAGGRFFPPMFVWMVDGAGEDMAAGFENAAEVYHARASHGIEMMLYGAMPVSVLLLGSMLLGQSASMMVMVVRFLEMI